MLVRGVPQRDCVLGAVHRSTSTFPQSEIVPCSSGVSAFSNLTQLQTRNEVPCHPPGQGSQCVRQSSSQVPLDATLNATLRHPTASHPKLSQALDSLAFPPDAESIVYTVTPTLSLSPSLDWPHGTCNSKVLSEHPQMSPWSQQPSPQ